MSQPQSPSTPALEIGPGMGFGVFPNDGLSGRLAYLWERAALRLFGLRAYRSVSILPEVCRVLGLESAGQEVEFLERYEASREGVQELWRSRERQDPAACESFYGEHDADLWRQAYRAHFSRSYRSKLLLQARIVGRQAAGSRDLAVLDYGCGAGVLAHRLLDEGYTNVHLADVPSPTLEFCRAAFGERLASIQEVGSSTPLRGQFDLITCLDCLEHTVDPLRIALELVDALRPRGSLVVSYPLETDFSFSHTPEAAAARPAVMAALEERLEVVLSQRVYRKP